MSESRKVHFNNETKPLLVKTATIPKLQLKSGTVMNDNGVINPLEDLVQCVLCLDKMKDPKMLICQHTFCLNCLQYYLPSGAKNIECPSCKKTTILQNGFGSLEYLPGNMYIDSILNVLSGGNSARIPNKHVEELLCIKCQTICQFLEHTCQHCEQKFCENCWTIHLNELSDNIKSLNEQLNDYNNRLDHQIDIFQDRCVKIEAIIRETTEIKINKLKQQEENCLKEVVQLKKNEDESSEEIRARIKELQTSINEFNFNEISDDAQKISEFMALHQNTAHIFEDLTHWADKRINFDATTYKIDREIDATPDAEADEELPNNNSSISANPLEDSDSLIAHYKSRRFTPKLTWTKCTRPASVAVAPWNNNYIYIAGTDSRNIYVIDKQKGKLLSRISNPCMLCPSGLTFSAEEIFVTDKWKHCIHVFSQDGNYIKTIGKKGSASGQFRSPEGIAYNNSRLYICDTGNDRVQVLNALNGSFMFSFGITGAGKAITGSGFVMDIKYTELNMPTGIAVSENRVIVVDSGNRRIKTYTLEGNKITEFGSLGKNRGQFRSPEVVAVDPLGFILVGDSGNARVQVFRPNGTLVRVFGHKGNLAWVSGLCVTPQLDIIVSDYKNHKVHVF